MLNIATNTREQNVCTPSYVVYDTRTIASSLVTANMQPIMQELADVDTFLLEIEPQIIGIAKRLYYGLLPKGIELEDLAQVGRIAAWKATQTFNAEKATNESSHYAYALLRARGDMVDFIRKHYRTGGNAESIEGLIIPDSPRQARPQSSVEKRKQIYRALSRLSRRQRMVIKAHFGIETFMSSGTCLTRDTLQTHYHITTNSYNAAKYEALRKLSHILSEKESATC